MRTFATKAAATAKSQPHFTSRAAAPMPHVRSILHDPRLQPKLEVGGANDPAEAEADRVAERVMRMPAPGEHQAPRSIAAREGASLAPDGMRPIVRREMADIEQEVEEPILPKLERSRAPDGGGESAASGTIREGLRGSGSPLPDGLRGDLEGRFGYGLDHVRVYNSPASHAAAKSISAKAFTLGNQIAFAQGRYDPGSTDGRRLLSHEITHTLQQGYGVRRSPDETAPGAAISPDASGQIRRDKEIHLNLSYGGGHHQTARLHDGGSVTDFTTSAGTGDLTSRHVRLAPYGIGSKVGPPPARSPAWGLTYFMPFVGGLGFHSNLCRPRKRTLCAAGESAYCGVSDPDTRIDRTLTVDGTPHSHGCARLRHADSQTLFSAVPVGTRVYVYDRLTWRSPSWSSSPDRAQPP